MPGFARALGIDPWDFNGFGAGRRALQWEKQYENAPVVCLFAREKRC
jgi:hypothetical protein